jgi:hypothetical protein
MAAGGSESTKWMERRGWIEDRKFARTNSRFSLSYFVRHANTTFHIILPNLQICNLFTHQNLNFPSHIADHRIDHAFVLHLFFLFLFAVMGRRKERRKDGTS